MLPKLILYNFKSIVLACSIVAALSACTQLKPDEPEKQPFDAPISTKMSFVSTPIILPISALKTKINVALKEVIVNDESYENNKQDNLKLKIVRMGEVSLQMVDNELFYSAPLKIFVDKRFETKILAKKIYKSQAITFALRAKFKSRVDIGNDWQIQSQTSFVGLEWIEKPSLNLMLFKIDLTKTIEKILLGEVPAIEKMIDKLAHDEIHIDQEILHIWTELQKPILINRAHKKIWIKARPVEFTASHVRSDGENILIDGKIGAMMETLFGESPPHEILAKLPTLQRAEAIPNTCDLNAVSDIYYADINELLDKQLAGKEFELEGNKLKINNLRIYGSGSFVVVRVEVKGDANGTIFLKGKPFYDNDESQTIRIQDFNFDINTQETLIGTADWLLHDTFKNLIQEKLHFPLKSEVEKLPELIYKGIAKGKIGKKIDIQLARMSLIPQKIAVHEDRISILLNMKTDLVLKLKRL
jgi:hypothetical protein